MLHVGAESSRGIWVIVEMKGRVAHPQHIAEQLQAGADVIQNSSGFKIPRSPQRLIALLLRDRRIHTADSARRHIIFCGPRVSILYKRCGIKLEDYLA